MLKKSMSFHAFTLAGMLFIPTLASSHSAHDPIKDIQEYNRDVRQRQSDFQTATNPEEQLKKFTVSSGNNRAQTLSPEKPDG